MIDARLVHDAFDPSSELATFTAAADGAGAVASFVGLVRGGDVRALFLDHHPRLTARSLDEIAAAAAARFAVSDVLVIHRCGRIPAGDPIVLAAAAAPHRRAALEAVDYLMDRLKSEAVLWKREDAVDGSRWIEPTDADRAALARWST